MTQMKKIGKVGVAVFAEQADQRQTMPHALNQFSTLRHLDRHRSLRHILNSESDRPFAVTCRPTH